ncbi:hypothetical protein PYCCODRAFT_1475728 [Trametes coccinea BRFM310]|uniref:DUF6535 domain-containing protein n=1 Tax=Trametes coccinea (strain BRFM310) TaxID=1353009 RepID=A0A1Y2IVK7_TRAC3|nr:hypothetical protein PYCCODRAFT_1475728 [Trametes coccinea BRFM310]
MEPLPQPSPGDAHDPPASNNQVSIPQPSPGDAKGPSASSNQDDRHAAAGVVGDKGWDSSDPQSILAELQTEYAEVQSSEAQDSLDKAAYSLHDKTLDRYQQELDALLIYAGLFSAILTAFNVESYRLLQPDATESNASAIRDLAAELRILALNVDRTETTGTLPLRARAPTPFQPPSFVVWVNCLWFASLVISLASATIALLVKQWLYEARTGISGQSRASTQLLQYRIQSIEGWKVRGIALLVPLLLQVALLVFLAGLLILLYNLHTVVAAVSTAFAGLLFLFLVVVTLLPAFYGGCCYRSPQARLVATAVRPIRNHVRHRARQITRFFSRYTVQDKDTPHAHPSKGLKFSYWVFSAFQKPFVNLSRAPRCLPWRDQEQVDLRERSGPLDVKTAVTAWATTLDPTHLDNMRIALSGEPNAPLVDCLRHLGINMDGEIDLPAALSKRNVSRRLVPIVLTALRQMLTIDRAKRRAHSWESVVQQLLNMYTYTGMSLSSESHPPHDAEALRTAFFVLMEATSIENRYAALYYLCTAVDVDSDAACDYKRVSRIFSAAERWIKQLRSAGERQLQEVVRCPQTTLTAFRIIVHCMLRITEGKTAVPSADIESLRDLYKRACTVLSDLSSFLPPGEALLEGPEENKRLCDELAFGLQPLIPLLIRLSRPNPSNALRKPSIPDMVPVHVADALYDVWIRAKAVLTFRAIRSNLQVISDLSSAFTDTLQDVWDGLQAVMKLNIVFSAGTDSAQDQGHPDADPVHDGQEEETRADSQPTGDGPPPQETREVVTKKLEALQADIGSFFPAQVLGPLPHSS